jgi:hypothetical protein
MTAILKPLSVCKLEAPSNKTHEYMRPPVKTLNLNEAFYKNP